MAWGSGGGAAAAIPTDARVARSRGRHPFRVMTRRPPPPSLRRMTTAVTPHRRPSATGGASPPQQADVFVAFGISGDLAKVMTFRSLYRLEARGLLNCPIVGVAVDDWSADDLRAHART